MQSRRVGEEFVALYNQSGSERDDNVATIADNGKPVILKYDGENLPWRVPVHISSADWERLLFKIKTVPEVEFWLTVDEGLFVLLENEYREPHVHLVRDGAGYVWFEVVDHGCPHALGEFASRCRRSWEPGGKRDC